ncbi:hypothetical protein L210DRAFT_3509863 [Boletus edulis BED1]|uniref:Uncharacterized protein n=1 Tax=Boletus edulis BED1 TaxID=1328754 RepID=A0AAD4BEJ0_BOLED|nr:hypothetical protein L210DRAFT_3509863 [Boletus edulis BED1]
MLTDSNQKVQPLGLTVAIQMHYARSMAKWPMPIARRSHHARWPTFQVAREPLDRCKEYNRGAVPKELADSVEPSYEDEEKIAKKEMYFKSSTIDFIVQGIPQTASETLMENSDKRSLFTDGSAGSVGKYYAIVSAMVIRRNPPSLHRVTTLSDPDLSGATYDRNAVPEESYSSLG